MIRFREALTAVAAASLAFAPTVASAASPVAQSSVRASADQDDVSDLIGGGFLPVILLAIVGIAAIVALEDGQDDTPVSA